MSYFKSRKGNFTQFIYWFVEMGKELLVVEKALREWFFFF